MNTEPCGHDSYDILTFGGPGSALKCRVCGHEFVTPPNDLAEAYKELSRETGPD